MDVSKHMGRERTRKEHFKDGTNSSELLIEYGGKMKKYKHDDLTFLEHLLYTHSLWASLVAQTVKNSPAVRETWVQSLGWEESLEKGTATHSSILTWRIPRTEEPGGLVHVVAESRARLTDQQCCTAQ